MMMRLAKDFRTGCMLRLMGDDGESSGAGLLLAYLDHDVDDDDDYDDDDGDYNDDNRCNII